MSLSIRKNEDVETENSRKFIPYHHITIFERTYEPAKRGEGVVCAIICFTVVEAFINDIIAFYGIFEKNAVRIDKKSHPANYYLSDEEISMLEKLRAAEREDIHTKLSIIGEWDKSEKWYQQFSELKRIRNELVHLKSEEIVICKDTGKRSDCPRFLNNLLQKNIIARPETLTSWIELLEERKFCLWCQEVTYQILMATKDKLPPSNVKDYVIRQTYFSFSNNT